MNVIGYVSHHVRLGSNRVRVLVKVASFTGIDAIDNAGILDPRWLHHVCLL